MLSLFLIYLNALMLRNLTFSALKLFLFVLSGLNKVTLFGISIQ